MRHKISHLQLKSNHANTTRIVDGALLPCKVDFRPCDKRKKSEFEYRFIEQHNVMGPLTNRLSETSIPKIHLPGWIRN